MGKDSEPTGNDSGPASFRDRSLAGVLRDLEVAEGISETRRRDMASGVRRIAELIGRTPDQLPADVRAIKKLLEGSALAQAGLSRKTLGNLRSNLLSALRVTGTVHAAARIKLDPTWAVLFEALPDKRFHSGLSRFMRYCSSRGIAPEHVNDETVASFITALEADTFVENIKEARRRTTRLWNEAVDQVPNWPQQHLAVPDQRKPRESLPLSAYPEAFTLDVERYLAFLRDEDPFAGHRPPRGSKPGTIRLIRTQIELAASGLVQAGHAPTSLLGLADLVEPEAFKTILRHYRAKAGGKSTTFTRGIATMLIKIARHWVRVNPGRLEELKTLRGRLGRQRAGLTDKNRAALMQLDDDGNRARLLLLPETLFREALHRDTGSISYAVQGQVALVLEILLNCPMRSQNLLALQPDKHIIRPGGPKGAVFFAIPGDDVKNGQPLDFELPSQLAAMLDTYIRKLRPRLLGRADTENPFLFPGENGKHKAHSTLLQQVTGTIQQRTGMTFTLHQFRHIAAKLLLEQMPENYEMVTRILGHANSKTALAYYTGLQSGPATKFYDELLAKQRDELRRTPAKTLVRRPRKSKRQLSPGRRKGPPGDTEGA